MTAEKIDFKKYDLFQSQIIIALVPIFQDVSA